MRWREKVFIFLFGVLLVDIFPYLAWSQKPGDLSIDAEIMVKVIKNASACRLNSEDKSSTNKVMDSARCYDKYLAKDLSPIRAANVIRWFNLITDIRGWRCGGEKYQIESFSHYTPHFLCVEGRDQNSNKKFNLIFFHKDGEELRIWSIYEPIQWLRNK